MMEKVGTTSTYGEGEEPFTELNYASSADHASCKRLHRRFGKTYFFATRRLPAHLRRRIHALYGFVRVPDEWVDNGPIVTNVEREQRLDAYRSEFIRGMDGVPPRLAVLRAFCDTARDCSMKIEEPLRFLEAMKQDITKSRYGTYEELREYMRGSASAVGLMMCDVLEADRTDSIRMAAIALGEAMQLTNFLRDVGEDMRRGRIYLPGEDLDRFTGSEEGIYRGKVTPGFIRLMNFEIERARGLYAEADLGIPLLPVRVQPAVKLARILYSRILNRIESRGYDVFNGRARTSSAEKLTTAFRVFTGVV